MLNERQKAVVIKNVNEELNIPLITEDREGRMIENLVDRILPNVEPALLVIIPEIYVQCIRLALNERLPIHERRDQISDLMRGELSEPLARQLNERVDMSIVPENLEGTVLKVVANKVIDRFVQWTVGEMDENFREVDESEEYNA